MRTAAKTAFLLAILTLISKFLGFLREMFMANYFGTSYIVDAYVVSTSIPGMIFAGVLGAISTSFIPIFSNKVESEGLESANRFTSQAINLLVLISVISSVIGIVFSDQIVWVFASGFEGETAHLASFYVKVTFSFTLFTATGNILESYLKYKNVFLSPTIAGYSISLLSIIFIIIGHYTNPYYLIWGTFLGAALRTGIIAVIAKVKEYHHKMDFHVTDTVKQIFILALPVFIGSTASQINVFINKALATRLPEGSAAAINYSDLLIGLITGVSSMVVATILYPRMAQAFSQNDNKRFSSLYNSGISILIMIGVPFTLGALIYGHDILQIIYERGAFDPQSTSFTYTAFFYYSFGLVFMALQPFLIQTFYSMHNTKTPLKIGITSVGVNIISNLILVKFLAHGGLALGTSIAAFVDVALLIYCINNKTDIDLNPQTPKKAIKILIASIISIGLSYLFYIFVGENIWMPRMLLMTMTVAIAVLAYLFILKKFKIEELVHIREIFKIS